MTTKTQPSFEATSGDVPFPLLDSTTLTKRLQLLQDAIRELDEALKDREDLSNRFREQIDKEIQEVHYNLSFLPPPWREGFYPEMESLRLNLHRSLTNRSDTRRSEELRVWEQKLSLIKEKRKLLTEYEILKSMKERLQGSTSQ